MRQTDLKRYSGTFVFDPRDPVFDEHFPGNPVVPGSLIEFTPTQRAQARKLVGAMDGVLEVQTYGRMLHVLVDDSRRRQPQIRAALAAQGIAHQGLREIEVRMEEAFISLIRRQSQ